MLSLKALTNKFNSQGQVKSYANLKYLSVLHKIKRTIGCNIIMLTMF